MHRKTLLRCPIGHNIIWVYAKNMCKGIKKYDFSKLLPSFSDANIVLENSRENSHSRDLLNIKRAVLRFGAD